MRKVQHHNFPKTMKALGAGRWVLCCPSKFSFIGFLLGKILSEQWFLVLPSWLFSSPSKRNVKLEGGGEEREIGEQDQ